MRDPGGGWRQWAEDDPRWRSDHGWADDDPRWGAETHERRLALFPFETFVAQEVNFWSWQHGKPKDAAGIESIRRQCLERKADFDEYVVCRAAAL
jgi:hypothetical protein